jgi:hypothetical protein
MTGRAGLGQPADGRRVMGAVAGIALIAIGVIVRFAVAAGTPHGLNVQAVGVVLMLAGLLGVVLSLLVWGPLNPGRRRDRLRGYDGAAPPSGAGGARVYQDQPPM